MHRFSILYLLKGQYYHITYPTRLEAEDALSDYSPAQKGVSLGVYDAKTELFSWVSPRQTEYNHLSIEEQGRRGNEIIKIVEHLRSRDEEGIPSEIQEENVLTPIEEATDDQLDIKVKPKKTRRAKPAV
jgi:hypothetical protein